jgi:epoxide hydrolase-like predicted phosphatase
LIKTIIFDLGNVLVPFDFKRAYAQMEPLCPYAAVEIRARLRSTDLVQRYETGQLTTHAFIDQLTALLELRVTHDEFRQLWSSIFLPPTLVPESLLAGLKRKYRMLVLSNTNELHFEMVEANYPVVRHFDEFVLSHKVGAAKPSARIYEAALEKAGCRPEECFFTDDLLPFVEGARRAGIDAVQFLNVAQLEADLTARGITW